MNFADIFRTASANMLRSKTRTFLTIIAIFIGAFTLTVTNGIGAGVSQYIDKQVGNIGAEDALFIQAKSERGLDAGPQKYDPEQNPSQGRGFGPSLPVISEDELATIKSVPGVISVEPQIFVSPDYVMGANGEKYELSTSPYLSGTNLALATGQSPDNESDRNEIVLPPDYPAVLGYASSQEAVGQQVSIGITSASGQQTDIEATVVGVQEDTLTSIAGASINTTLVSALRDIQTEGRVSEAQEQYPVVVARVNENISESDLTQIKNDLDTKGYMAMTIEDQIGAFKQVIDAIIVVLNVFAGIALLAASFGIINTLFMAVQERTKEIGLMKAMGMGSGKIFLLFSTEAVLLGFWGSLLGSLVGMGVGSVANQVASDTFLKDLPGFNLTAFPLQSILIIMLIIMVIAFIAGTLPARRAAKLNPIDALRYE